MTDENACLPIFLVTSLAHQINNALAPMRLSLGRLVSFELSRRPISEERLHCVELLQDVREGVARIERIVHQLRAFSHTEDTTRRAIELPELLEIALALASHDIQHRARLVRDYNPVPLVRARPARLRQAILSVLLNAANAIPDGQTHLNELRVSTRTDSRGFAVVEISDTGTGIAAEDLPRIFDPFFTTRSTGLGLGLAMTRDVVTAEDGQIEVESEIDVGTKVTMTFPPTDDAPEFVELTDSEPAKTKVTGGLRILIVDDDRPVAAAIGLELARHDVVVAESGREALGILHEDSGFDLILCDLMMPDVSGIDVYEAIRATNPRLLSRVVIMTGGAFTTRADQFLSAVETPVLEKPFEPGQLHAIVETFQRRRQTFASTSIDPASPEAISREDSTPI